MVRETDNVAVGDKDNNVVEDRVVEVRHVTVRWGRLVGGVPLDRR